MDAFYPVWSVSVITPTTSLIVWWQYQTVETSFSKDAIHNMRDAS